MIVNWRTRELLRACLESVYRHPPTEPFEVIVVENDSGDGSAEMVRESFPAVRLLVPPRNLGYAEGNNIAFEAASGERLLTLNPDTEALAGTFDEAVAALDRNPAAGVVGIRQLSPDGSTQASVRGFPTLIGLFGEWMGLARLFPDSPLGSYRMPNFDYGEEQICDQPMGTFLLFRREALPDPDRPFDPSFPLFFNEVDLLRRMRDAGWPAVYTPRARILHHGGMATRQVRPMAIWESHRSLLRYLRGHRSPLANLLTLPWLVPLVTVAAFVRARGWRRGF